MINLWNKLGSVSKHTDELPRMAFLGRPTPYSLPCRRPWKAIVRVLKQSLVRRFGRLARNRVGPGTREGVYALLLVTASSLYGSERSRGADYDVVVYGGTSAAVTAAVQAKRLGKSVIVVCPDKHLGGLILGHSAGTAASIAIDERVAVQEVPYPKLRERLLRDGQVLESAESAKAGRGRLDPSTLKGIVLDDSQAMTTGNWIPSTASATCVGNGYRHEGNQRDGAATARFVTRLTQGGRYEVQLAYTPHGNRATRVAVEVHHAGGKQAVKVNQRVKPPVDDCFVSLGKFDFTAGQDAAVIVSNADADGYVVIDAVRWLPLRD